jgi:hypothetical protein
MTPRTPEEWLEAYTAPWRRAFLQGHLEERRDALLGLMEQRFGSVPEPLVEQIRLTNDVVWLHLACLKMLAD